MQRVLVVTLVALTAGSSISGAPRQVGKTFDVVSLRVNTSGGAQSNVNRTPSGVTITNHPLRVIVQLAYGISQPARLIGLPDWAERDRFDLAARGSVGSLDDFRAMMQAMLTERFGFAAHTEQRNVPSYNLVLARRDGKLGPSLMPSTKICPNGLLGGRGRAAGAAPDAQRTVDCSFHSAPGEIELPGAPISSLVSFFSLTQGRPVVDRTGLAGRYDMHLVFAPEPIPGAPPQPGFEGRATITTAIQEQLGLKLEAATQPEDVLVIDRVSKPSEN